ncbi:MAG TPA: hypothetical protein PKN30_05160, partial [Flavobacteriales bacterium]|nr:hypothetical protein [Flavobacteriales bacterium]
MPATSQAQVIDESFDAVSLPAGWTQEYVSGSSNWNRVTANGNSTITPHSGAGMAEFRVNNYNGDATKLVTPSMDLTTLTSPQLSFFYANVDWGGDIDELRIFYKTSAGGSWVQIGTDITTAHSSWTEVVLALPNATSDYYVAFEGTSGYGRGMDIDDVLIDEAPACPDPSALGATNFTTSGADLGWTENGSATAWDLEIGADGFSPTGTPTHNDVGANPYTWSGGSANTAYDFYVRADCGMDDTDVSAWVGPYTFTTLCNALNVPYTEDFESATTPALPACMSVEDLNGATTWITSATSDIGTGQAARYPYSGSTAADDWLYSAGLNLVGGTSYTVSYQYTANGFDESLEVYYGASASAAGMTELIADHGTFDDGPYTVTYNFTPASNGVYYIGWHAYSAADQFYLAVDNISVIETPSCPDPTVLTATNPTAVGADLGWTENGTATAWDLEIGVDGFSPTGTPTHNDVGNAYTWTGGAALTDYDFYVRADCGMDDTDVSNWVGPFSFTTGCPVYTPDYLEDFTTFLDPCWTEATGPITGPTAFGASEWTSDDFGNVFANGLSARFNIYTTGSDEWLITPTFDLSSGGYELNFDVALTAFSGTASQTINPDDAVYLMQSVDGGSTWTTINTWDNANSPSNTGDNTTIDISAITSSTVQFAFFALEGGTSGGDMNFYVDNFQVRTPPACPDPSALSAINPTTSGADLGWTENGSATAWDLEIGVDGFSPTGTPTHNDVGANPYTWSGGAASTSYDFYVRADCGMDDTDVSAWVGPFSFTTACDAYTIPFSEDFNSVTTPGLPICWSVDNVNGATTWLTASAPTGFTGNVARYPYDGSVGGDDWLFTPGLDLVGGTTYTLTYTYAAQSTFFAEAMDVYYGNAASAGAMSDLIVDHGSFAFLTPSTVSYNITPGSTGVYYIGWHSYSGANEFNINLDDISVVETPACPDPTGVSVSGTTYNGTNVNFTCSGCTGSVIVEFGVSPHTPGVDGTAGVGGTLVTGAVSPQAISLAPSTTYQIYVRQDCSLAMDGYSNNTAAVNVTTPPAPPANDLCENAIPVSCNSVTNASTVNATTTGAPAGSCDTYTMNTAGGIWYTLQGFDGTMTIDLSGSSYDTRLAVYSGTCGSFSCVAGDDDDGAGTTSLVSFTGSSAITYYVYVTGYLTNTGSVVMSITCGDTNPACTENGLNLEFQNDANPGQVTWEVLNSGNLVVLSGADPVPANNIGTQSLCLPDGCYRLRVLDSFGDGMTTGGYELRTSGGDRIIDNTNNFSTGSVSAISGNQTFCLPLGTVSPIWSSCDKLDWVNNKFIVCHADAAVSAQYGVTNATSGYEFWFYDPNGSFSYRRFRSHATSDGYGSGATRACHFKVNGWYASMANPHIPADILLNVRVRGRVAGVNQNFGPACQFKIDAALAACPRVKLQDNPANTSDYSCGVSRNFGGPSSPANRIYANPPQPVPVV